MELIADEILQRSTGCKHGSDESTCVKCKDAQRKRDERARKKEAQAAAASTDELNAAKSFPEFWKAKRANLSDAQRAEKEAREEYVLDVEPLMKRYLDNHDQMVTEQSALPEDERVSLQQLIDAVEEDVKAHGICESIILVVPKLWTETEKNLRERILARGGATATLLTYGYRTALDGFLYERFYQKFLVKRQPRVPKPEVFYVSLTCSVCNAPPTSVTSETAAAYARSREYACANCLDKAAKLRNFTQEQRSPDHAIFDGWGRVLDQ
jgi:hypothetical protein